MVVFLQPVASEVLAGGDAGRCDARPVEYFSLEGKDTECAENEGCSNNTASALEEDLWVRECRELRASRLTFQLKLQEQQMMDCDISMLLRRLHSLSSAGGDFDRSCEEDAIRPCEEPLASPAASSKDSPELEEPEAEMEVDERMSLGQSRSVAAKTGASGAPPAAAVAAPAAASTAVERVTDRAMSRAEDGIHQASSQHLCPPPPLQCPQTPQPRPPRPSPPPSRGSMYQSPQPELRACAAVVLQPLLVHHLQETPCRPQLQAADTGTSKVLSPESPKEMQRRPQRPADASTLEQCLQCSGSGGDAIRPHLEAIAPQHSNLRTLSDAKSSPKTWIPGSNWAPQEELCEQPDAPRRPSLLQRASSDQIELLQQRKGSLQSTSSCSSPLSARALVFEGDGIVSPASPLSPLSPQAASFFSVNVTRAEVSGRSEWESQTGSEGASPSRGSAVSQHFASPGRRRRPVLALAVEGVNLPVAMPPAVCPSSDAGSITPRFSSDGGSPYTTPRSCDTMKVLRGAATSWPSSATSAPLSAVSTMGDACASASSHSSAFSGRTASHRAASAASDAQPSPPPSIEAWRGWTMRTTSDGSLFYEHAASGTSQWEPPDELESVLGKWIDHEDDEGNVYWRNELLGVASWRDPRKTTNLLHAALDGDLFFVQLYGHAGGCFQASDEEGRMALHLGCAGGSEPLMAMLLQYGAHVNGADNSGSTPLHWACRYGRASFVTLLLQAGANPDCQSRSGNTPLHEAASLGRLDALACLLRAGANPWLRNGRYQTPAELASLSNQGLAAQMLQGQSKPQQRPLASRPPRPQTQHVKGGSPLADDASGETGSSSEDDHDGASASASRVAKSAMSGLSLPPLGVVRNVWSRLFGDASVSDAAASPQRARGWGRFWEPEDDGNEDEEDSETSSDSSDDDFVAPRALVSQRRLATLRSTHMPRTRPLPPPRPPPRPVSR